jgi:hypothetical protein
MVPLESLKQIRPRRTFCQPFAYVTCSYCLNRTDNHFRFHFSPMASTASTASTATASSTTTDIPPVTFTVQMMNGDILTVSCPSDADHEVLYECVRRALPDNIRPPSSRKMKLFRSLEDSHPIASTASTVSQEMSIGPILADGDHLFLFLTFSHYDVTVGLDSDCYRTNEPGFLPPVHYLRMHMTLWQDDLHYHTKSFYTNAPEYFIYCSPSIIRYPIDAQHDEELIMIPHDVHPITIEELLSDLPVPSDVLPRLHERFHIVWNQYHTIWHPYHTACDTSNGFSWDDDNFQDDYYSDDEHEDM